MMLKKSYTVVTKLEEQSEQEQSLLISLQALIAPTRREARYTVSMCGRAGFLFIF